MLTILPDVDDTLEEGDVLIVSATDFSKLDGGFYDQIEI